MRRHFIYLLVVFASRVQSQDFHLSQYDMAAQYLNPAETGMQGKEDTYRISLDQRSQWGSIGIRPFMTSYLAWDMPYMFGEKKVGVGAYLINNNGGLGGLNKFTLMMSGAYNIIGNHVRGSTAGKHLLSTGLQLGLFVRSVNPNALKYDIQYTPSGNFDPGISSNEQFTSTSIVRLDVNFGLYYRFIEVGKKYHPYAGFSLQHLSRPNESMVGGSAPLPSKMILNAGCNIDVNEKVEVTPRLLYMVQASAIEMMPGVLVKYKLEGSGWNLLGGADYRLEDAFILSLGASNEKYTLRFSYDFNASYLSRYTRSRGAWEVSFVYVGSRTKKPVVKSRASQPM